MVAKSVQRTLRIENVGTEARINPENAQIYSLVANGVDVMWPGGAPSLYRPNIGWQNSDIVMFPIVGSAPDKERNAIHINGKEFRLGQHGLLRDMKDFTLIDHGSDFAEFEYYYEAMSEVERPAANGKPRLLQSFPFSFNLRKRYSIDLKGALRLRVLLTDGYAHLPMPYMLGWHPAFRTVASGRLLTDHVNLTLDDVRNEKDSVMDLPYESSIQYWNPEFSFVLRHTFGHMQVWSTEACTAIEPITGRAASRLGLDPNADFRTLPNVRRLGENEKEEFEASIILVRK